MNGRLSVLMVRDDEDGRGWDALQLRSVRPEQIAALEAYGWIVVTAEPRQKDNVAA